MLTPGSKCLDEILLLKSEKRQVEKLATHLLLTELLGHEFQIYYSSSGKPNLVGGSFHISISHTAGYVAVVLSNTPVGVDIQLIEPRIEGLKRRFVSSDEYIDPVNPIVHLSLHWSAKEAMFKWLDTADVDFKNHLHVKPFPLSEQGFFNVFETKTSFEQDMKGYYEVDTDFVLVLIW